jgi:hypothetical protein
MPHRCDETVRIGYPNFSDVDHPSPIESMGEVGEVEDDALVVGEQVGDGNV